MSHHAGGLIAQTAGHWNIALLQLKFSFYDLHDWVVTWLAHTPVESRVPKGRFPQP